MAWHIFDPTTRYFHGASVPDIRSLTGIRVNRPSEAPSLRTTFNASSVLPHTRQGERGSDYPRAYGPGLYVTEDSDEAAHYATQGGERSGAVVSGFINAAHAVSLTPHEFREIANSHEADAIAQRMIKSNRFNKLRIPSVDVDNPQPAKFTLDQLKETSNFSDIHPESIDYLKSQGMTPIPSARIVNGRTILTAHRSAANMLLRQGHDFLHINHDYDDGMLTAPNMGVVLRPNTKGIAPVFKPDRISYFNQGRFEHTDRIS